ncbi:putative POT family protein [Rosellinia necatrix]|uniref:Putative POT family protein n=1 Tax=Rosellinia necatrix TaxID=77044 RepID=A0A1S8A839_ROSNE|nr:putative POT family protein [Rosellinia necatrix]
MADGRLGVDEHLLPGLEHLRVLALVLVLVDEGRRHVGLEDAGPDGEQEKANEERRDAFPGLEQSWRGASD